MEGLRLTALERAGTSRAAGAAVWVAFDEDPLVFDAETGARAG